MAERVAFLIGNQTFRPDSGLLPLQGPANDVAALARLLGDPERGRCKVQEFLDKPCHEVLPEIEDALGRAAPGDLVLIYYSGHGKQDRNGALCLATADTRQTALTSTSIPARRLTELVERSDCDQVVLLLDCCYSGAVEDGFRGDVTSELHVVENARGFYIMTASSGVQTARETETAGSGAVMGRFTAALVNGIESGAADLGRTGKIVLSDLRRYVERVVTSQTPQFFARRASGDPVISLNPATAPLDAGMLADLAADQWYRRLGAVLALAGVLSDGDLPAQATVRAALRQRLRHERDYTVRAELEAALGIGFAKPRDRLHSAVPSTEAIMSEATAFPTTAAPSSAPRMETASELFTRGLDAFKAGQDEKAAGLFELATDQGNAYAQTSLGWLYEQGRGVQQSHMEAARLYRLAADQGLAEAQTYLGVLYEVGVGVQQSYTEAAGLFELAADQGNARAQIKLGSLYEQGRGVQQSHMEAARLYKLAADQGNARAQYDLNRVLYTQSLSVQQSVAQAEE